MADSTIFLDCVSAIVAQLSSNWATLPILTDNDDAEGLDLDSGFVFVDVDFSNAVIGTINSNSPRIHKYGNIFVNIHTPRNVGVGQGLTYAGEIAEVYRGKQFNGVNVLLSDRIASKRPVDSDYGKFWLTPLIIPFYYDRVIAIS